MRTNRESIGLRNMRGLTWAAAILALAACGRESAQPSTPAGVAAQTSIDFAHVANYAAPTLPAYFDETVAALDNSPASNPADDRVATLGRVLFHDLRLSTNNRASCATCHQQRVGFTDPMRFSNGISTAGTTDFHAMRLGNLRYWQPGTMFWDRRAPMRRRRRANRCTAWSRWAGARMRGVSRD